MARSVTAPLKRIVVATGRFSQGEYVPINPQGPEEIQALARAFNIMAEQVHASQQSQRDFVANVSHELKTPLTSIQGFSQALLDGTADDPDSRQQAARIIYTEAGRMHRMVLALLDLARMDAGTLSYDFHALDLRALLTDVVDKFTPQAKLTNVNLQLEVEATPKALGDIDRLSQVFNNLVDNALKNSPPGKNINIQSRQLGNWIEIALRDQGPGIQEDELERIFERFYQTDKSRRGGAGHGMGLGLAITREIIQAHGGEINVYSNSSPSHGTLGTVFVVKLPVAPFDAS